MNNFKVFYKIESRASVIIFVKEFCLSSLVASAPVIKLSDTVRIQAAS